MLESQRRIFATTVKSANGVLAIKVPPMSTPFVTTRTPNSV